MGPNRARLETYLQGVEAAAAELDTAIDNWKTVSVRLGNAAAVLTTQKGVLPRGFGEDSEITSAATGAFERSTTKLDDKSAKILDGWNALVTVRWRLQNALDARTKMDNRLSNNPDPGREPQKTDAAYAGVGGTGNDGWKADHDTWKTGHDNYTSAYGHAETASAHHIQLLDTAFADASTALRKVHGEDPVAPPGGRGDGGSGGSGSGSGSGSGQPTEWYAGPVGDPPGTDGGGRDGLHRGGGDEDGLHDGGGGGDGLHDGGGDGDGLHDGGGGDGGDPGGGSGSVGDPGVPRSPYAPGDGRLDGGLPSLPDPGGLPRVNLPAAPAASAGAAAAAGAGDAGAFELGGAGAGLGGLGASLSRAAGGALPTTGVPGIGAGGRPGGPGVVGGAGAREGSAGSAAGAGAAGRGGAGGSGGRGGRGGAGATAGRRGRSRDRDNGQPRDLWDDGEDWIDDEGAGPSVLE